MKRELVIKFAQANSEGFILLPSKVGVVLLRDKLAKDKIKYEEVQVAFAGKQVMAFKFEAGGYGPTFFHIESYFKRNQVTYYMWYGPEDMGMRTKFTLPIFVDVPDEPTENK